MTLCRVQDCLKWQSLANEDDALDGSLLVMAANAASGKPHNEYNEFDVSFFKIHYFKSAFAWL